MGQPSGSTQTGHSRPQADMGDRCLYRRRHERNCDATVSQRMLALARMHVSHVSHLQHVSHIWRRASRAASRPALKNARPHKGRATGQVSRDQWKMRYRITSTITGTPRSQPSRLGMMYLLSYKVGTRRRLSISRARVISDRCMWASSARESPVNQGKFSRNTMLNCTGFTSLIASRLSRTLRKIRKQFPTMACGVCVINASIVPTINNARETSVSPCPTKRNYRSERSSTISRATPSDPPPLL